jgi:sulfatase maturation enzyme AslB (radical SAM superfamily)/tetratricopeptide (TPR) repeat protein
MSEVLSIQTAEGTPQPGLAGALSAPELGRAPAPTMLVPLSTLRRPQVLNIEITSLCNMHCTFCPSDDLQRPKQHLSHERALKMIEAAPTIVPRGAAIWFHVLGEPLLNKRVFEYMDRCDQLKARFGVVTNATLLTPDSIKKIFSHPTLIDLAMSLHTPTQTSFAARGYSKITLEQYIDRVCEAITAKFSHGNHASVKLFVATEQAQQPNMSDAQRLWTLFPDENEFQKGFRTLVERMAVLAADIRARFGPEVQAELDLCLPQVQQSIARGEVVLDPNTIPPASNATPSGWMFLPNVFLMPKPLWIWSYHEPFIRRHSSSLGMVSFHEDQMEPFTCPTAEASFGVLSNGDYTLCCMDVEGGMDLGNIDDLEPMDAVRSQRRADIIANAAVSRVCRRCRGNNYMLATEPLPGISQTIDKFGQGFREDACLPGNGRRFHGKGNAYFFTRIDATEICLNFYSPLPDESKFTLLLERLADAEKQTFVTEERIEFQGQQNRPSCLIAPVRLQASAFYRLTLLSPSIAPAQGLPDGEQPGVLVTSMRLLGRPFSSRGDGSATDRSEKPVSTTKELHDRGVQLYLEGRFGEALTLLQGALEPVVPAEWWNDWAAAELACGHADKAEGGFRRACSVSPGNGEAAANLGALLASQRRVAEAIPVLEHALVFAAEDQRSRLRQLLAESQLPGKQ